MKKTLFTAVMAFASAVAAVAATETPEPVLSLTPEDTLKSSYSKADTIDGANLSTVVNTRAAFTVTFLLDWDTLVTNSAFTAGNHVEAIWLQGAVNGRNMGFGLTKTVEDDVVDFSVSTVVGTTKQNTTISNLASYVDDSGKLTLTLRLGYDGATLFVLDSERQAYTKETDSDLFWSNNWGDSGQSYSTLYLSNLKGAVDYMQVYNSSLTDSQVLTVMKMIPEPTTATLSLLALAGLAARRRRK